MNRPDAPLRLQPVPASDAAFAGVVESAAKTAQSPRDLEARIRPLYPEVRLSEGGLSGEPRVYYLYRDGRYVPEALEAWWTDPAMPYVEIATTDGRISRATGSWAALMAVDPERLVGRPFSDFLLPEARQTGAELFAAILRNREVRSRLLLRRPDGSSLVVEYRAVCDRDICRVHYRPVQPQPGRQLDAAKG